MKNPTSLNHRYSGAAPALESALTAENPAGVQATAPTVTEVCRKIAASSRFTNFVIFIIIVAGVLVGIETFPSVTERHGGLLHLLNDLILGIFVAEIAIKMTSLAPRPWHYFRNGWNIFDFTIVAVCFLPFGGGYVAVLRLFRLLRVIRLVTVIPKLQVLVSALLRSLPSMFYVTILLFLVFYIYAVIGVMLFGANDPIHFGDLWTSLLSLFRVVTLEDWTDVMYLQMFGSDAYQGYNQSIVGIDFEPKAQPIVAAFYFVSFVLLGTMVMLNLVIGVIINGMDEAQKEIADRRIHELLTHGDEGKAEVRREHRIEILKHKMAEVTEELEKLA